MGPGHVWLAGAIVAEVVGTVALKYSEGFTKLVPTIVLVVAYAFAFWAFSNALKTVPLGISYALWSGIGIVALAIIGAVTFRQMPDLPALIGMGLILTGVVVINVFSKTSGH